MNKLIRAARTSQSLSLAAMEEASRFGLREADLEHLFLALVIDDQGAGRALRDAGITIHSARIAVKEQHDAQLASLGIDSAFPAGEQIVFHKTDGYEWTARARDLLAKSAGTGKAGNSDAVLRELIAEPSGLIHDILGRLGTSPNAVLDSLSSTASSTAETMPAPTKLKGHTTGSIETFVSAPIEQVWALLADPARIPEWDTNIGTIEHSSGDPAPGMTWEGAAVTAYPDGRASKVKPQFRRRSIELISADHPRELSWSLGYPDVDGRKPILTTFILMEATGGTQVQISRSWAQSKGWRKIVAVPLRPIQKFLLWLSLFQTGSALSRSFR